MDRRLLAAASNEWLSRTVSCVKSLKLPRFRFKSGIGFAGLALLALAVTSRSWAEPQPASSPGVQWQHDLKAAHKLAVATKRPLLLVFGAAWCTHCRQYEMETLGDAALTKYVNSEFVPVHLDFDKDRRVADILEVTNLPTTVILNSDADLLGTAVGFVGKSECRKFLQKALDAERDQHAKPVDAPSRTP